MGIRRCPFNKFIIAFKATLSRKKNQNTIKINDSKKVQTFSLVINDILKILKGAGSTGYTDTTCSFQLSFQHKNPEVTTMPTNANYSGFKTDIQASSFAELIQEPW